MGQVSRHEAEKVGVTPSVVMVNPKFPHNVGAALRAASCYGVEQLWVTGGRVGIEVPSKKGMRLPREERMKGYQDVELRSYNYPLDCYGPDVVPVAVEVRENSEQLPAFEHPDNAVYVFGPEDGSIPKPFLHLCHRFVILPTRHCTNLAAAIYTVLYDRHAKRQTLGLEPVIPTAELIQEDRGWPEETNM